MAGLGVASQFMSIFKMFFGHPQLLIIEEVKEEDEKPTTDTKKLIKKLSSVFNNELDAED